MLDDILFHSLSLRQFKQKNNTYIFIKSVPKCMELFWWRSPWNSIIHATSIAWRTWFPTLMVNQLSGSELFEGRSGLRYFCFLYLWSLVFLMAPIKGVGSRISIALRLAFVFKFVLSDFAQHSVFYYTDTTLPSFPNFVSLSLPSWFLLRKE